MAEDFLFSLDPPQENRLRFLQLFLTHNTITMHKYTSCLLLIIMLSCSELFAQKPVPVLKRSQSFFGLHFDFHANETDSAIGKTLTEEMVDSMLTMVKPDFIQVDCKGHPGYSSYPTKVGIQAPGIINDPLKIFRKVTAKHGVALYVHYSGVFDVQALKKHPEWAVINADGKPDVEKTSVHSEYVRALMIPQFKELIKDYGINGVWVDGDCWGTKPDYGNAALQKFTSQTGITVIPLNQKDTGYFNFLEFSRRSFIEYVRAYVDSMHAFDPNFQVASNWAYSSFMPQPVNVNVDFLSGDLSPNNSVYSAAFEGRVLASQANMYNKPWDIMSWSFTLNWNRREVLSKKSVVQLTQEAAEIIAMGGGFQCYFQQNHDASIKPWQIQTMKGLAEFMRPRQKFCQYAKPVHQVALLYSNEARKRNSKVVYNNDGLEGIKGILNALLDGQQSVEVVMEHQLYNAMKHYPLIVIPEWNFLLPDFKKELLEYVNKGGNLLLIGPEAVQLFGKEAGIIVKDAATKNGVQYLGVNNEMSILNGLTLPVDLKPGTEFFGALYNNDDLRNPHIPAATIADYGKGKIASVLVNLGENYNNNKTSLQRYFINELVSKLFKSPVVKVEGSHMVHIALNTLGKKTVVHFINTGGMHADKNLYSYNEVPSPGPLKISLKIPRPLKITLQPSNRVLPFQYINGKALVTINRLAIHNMLVIE